MFTPLQVAKAVLFDLDGTLIRGEEAIPGAVEFVQELVANGKRIVYLTNNATRTREAVAKLLMGLGFPADPELVLTSSMAAASLLVQAIGPGKKVYVVGESGLQLPLEAAGFHVVSEDISVDAVVMGLDRQVTYRKLELAVRRIYEGAYFLATNFDRVIPDAAGYAPGAGSLVALVETATGIHPDCAGKPSAHFVQEALKLAGISAHEAVLIGDNPETDMLAAKRAGVYAILVTTGVPIDNQLVSDQRTASLEELLDMP